MEKKRALFLIFLIGVGFFLRVWRLREMMGFDYDQEVAAFAVDRILTGKLTLIGQEISLGGIFIGPGYYYLLSLFYLIFNNDPIGIGFMVAIFSIATMAALFLVTRELDNEESALIALAIYTTSWQINFYDRTTAPSNLVMLATLSVLLILLKLRSGRNNLLPFLAVTVTFTAVHLHPQSAGSCYIVVY
jgi:4-amino-4-deoxy-L-arabinose transferase-like glycosyltransferase